MARFVKSDITSVIAQAPRHDLGESLGPDLRLGELLDASCLNEMALGYGTVAGDVALRRAIADRHGVGEDDVVVTVGAMHALFLIAFVLCDRESEAVVTAPIFQPARTVLESVGAGLRALPLSFDRRYQPDVAELRPLLTRQTRLVSLASPQNPSGVAVPAATLGAIVAAMEELCPEAYLLVDETYREAVYGNDAVADSAIGLSRKIISTGSLSKGHGAPGLRLGWTVTRDPALREQLIAAKFSTVLSCSRIDETLGLKVLEQSGRIIGERRRHLAHGLEKVAAWIDDNAQWVEWHRPDAGALCAVRLKPAVFDDAAVARFHQELTNHGVKVTQGDWFGDEARVFRLGFGLLSPPALDAALNALSASLARTAGGRCIAAVGDPPGSRCRDVGPPSPGMTIVCWTTAVT
jgi:aspartate/methionine/tyrosine aminotransferase